ncbi:MAG: glycogen/starch/alpha-glucan phosphorylase [Mesorhizobium sp.]|nr:glycogen/starch/alpha-glucan phosphorylase [Mesorhizobium sp.]
MRSNERDCQMNWFSSDRTIREYAKDIWNVPA